MVCALSLSGLGLNASAASPAPDSHEPEWEILKLVNKERMAIGEPPLSMIKKMQEAADIRVEELQTEFSHTKPDGSGDFAPEGKATRAEVASMFQNYIRVRNELDVES